jgi:hypothetical protein
VSNHQRIEPMMAQPTLFGTRPCFTAAALIRYQRCLLTSAAPSALGSTRKLGSKDRASIQATSCRPMPTGATLVRLHLPLRRSLARHRRRPARDGRSRLFGNAYALELVLRVSEIARPAGIIGLPPPTAPRLPGDTMSQKAQQDHHCAGNAEPNDAGARRLPMDS